MIKSIIIWALWLAWIFACIRPALSDTGTYLIQQPYSACATDLWKGPQPVPGVNCAPGSLWCVFTPVNGDIAIQNYVCNYDNTQIYAPPPPPALITASLPPLLTPNSLSGQAGTVAWDMPANAPNGAKKCVIVLSGFLPTSDASITAITFPTPFVYQPGITSPTVPGMTIVKLTPTEIDFMVNSAKTATVIVEGI